MDSHGICLLNFRGGVCHRDFAIGLPVRGNKATVAGLQCRGAHQVGLPVPLAWPLAWVPHRGCASRDTSKVSRLYKQHVDYVPKVRNSSGQTVVASELFQGIRNTCVYSWMNDSAIHGPPQPFVEKMWKGLSLPRLIRTSGPTISDPSSA